ncbi:hypothetical protein HF577_06910 [Pseudonocardia xinjiangensis]|uniref:Lipoprotein n=2 Tax=Pseudonocardia xinjiangensis TaxID=75289 RepID=A0ABX1R8X7_9PSEU|nr:hypothetical protein [Pseudonocardia xinjiangensis]
MGTFISRYGARPAHLALLLVSFAVAAYAASFLLGDPALLTVLVWFVGAAVVHDLVLFPLYAAADGFLTATVARLPRPRVPVINHIRIPALGAGLTLLMFLPGIIRQGGVTHMAATGLDQQPYLGRWLWLVVVLFAVSAVVYGVRLLLARRSTGDLPAGAGAT